MSAVLQIYTSPGCTPSSELLLSGADYDLILGPMTGLDGDTGDRTDKVLYIKNTGDQAAIDVTLVKYNDTLNCVEFKTESMPAYKDDNVLIGDILVGEVVPLYIKVTVLKGTNAALVSPNFVLKYKSLP